MSSLPLSHGSSSASVSTSGVEGETLDVRKVESGEGDRTAEGNEVEDLSFMVAPQLLVGEDEDLRRDELSDGPVENPQPRRRCCSSASAHRDGADAVQT